MQINYMTMQTQMHYGAMHTVLYYIDDFMVQ